MALSNQEKQRRYRERQREKRLAEMKAADQSFADNVNRTPFFQTYNDHGESGTLHIAFDAMGMATPEFSDDSGPKSYEGILEDRDDGDDPYGGARGSLGRAEIMISCLLDAAITLAIMVQSHKLEEIEARIKDAERDLVRDPGSASKIATQLAALARMREDLQTTTRWSLPNWRTRIDDSES
jgi:hypothetical protein